MTTTLHRRTARAAVLTVVLALVLSLGLAKPAAAFAPPPAPVAPALLTAGGKVLTGAMATGSGGAVAAAGTVTVGGLAAAVLPAALIVGGAALLYVGYREFFGAEVEEFTDGAAVEPLAPGLVYDWWPGVTIDGLPGIGLKTTPTALTVTTPDVAPWGQVYNFVRIRYRCYNSSGGAGSLSQAGTVGPGVTTGVLIPECPFGLHTVEMGDSFNRQPGPEVNDHGRWTREQALLDVDQPQGQRYANGAEATLTTTGECTHLATGSTRVVTAVSDTFTSPEAPPIIPGVECDEDERLTDLDVKRVLPGPVDDLVLLDDFEIPEAPDRIPMEVVAEDIEQECEEYVTGEIAEYVANHGEEPPPSVSQEWLDDCLEMAITALGYCIADFFDQSDVDAIFENMALADIDASFAAIITDLVDDLGTQYPLWVDAPGECTIDVWPRDRAPDIGQPEPDPFLLPWNPFWDPLWWWDPNRDSDYVCLWGSFNSGYVPLDLEECVGTIPETIDEGTGTWTLTPPTQYPEAEPALPTPTPTGEPPAAPTPSRDCMDRRREDDEGWFSYYVFKGVSCALAWAFIPTQTMTAWDSLATEASTKPPFSIGTGVASWLTPLDADPASVCWVIEPQLHDAAGNVTLLDTCRTGGVEGWFHNNRALVGVVFYMGLFVPIAVWAWKAYAPGSQGMA